MVCSWDHSRRHVPSGTGALAGRATGAGAASLSQRRSTWWTASAPISSAPSGVGADSVTGDIRGPRLGQGHLNAERAAQALARLRPLGAVPVHWGTFWPLGLSSVRPHEFHSPGHAFVRHAARLAPGVRVHRLGHGESVRLAVDG